MAYLTAEEFGRAIEASKPYYEIEHPTITELVGANDEGFIVTRILDAETGKVIGEVGVMEDSENASE